jgi:hypothetical protein
MVCAPGVHDPLSATCRCRSPPAGYAAIAMRKALFSGHFFHPQPQEWLP